MEFDIKELTITLMVGAFTILGFETILHYFFNKGPIGFFKGKLGLNSGGAKEQPLLIVVLIVFAFGTGVIAEDLSLKYVDSDNFPFKKLPAYFLNLIDSSIIPYSGLPSADDDRAISLVKDFSHPDLDALATDLATNCAFIIDDTKGTGERVQRWILKGYGHRCVPPQKGPGQDDCASKPDIEASARSLYYYAKNTVYSRPEPYDELKRIEDRLQFERSVSMIAFIYFAIGFVVGLPLYIFNGIALEELANTKRIDFPPPSPLPGLRKKIPIVVGILFATYFFSIWAYARESDAFNRRAFGYLSTMLISEKHQREAARDQPAGDQAARHQLRAADQGVNNPIAQPCGTPQLKP